MAAGTSTSHSVTCIHMRTRLFGIRPVPFSVCTTTIGHNLRFRPSAVNKSLAPVQNLSHAVAIVACVSGDPVGCSEGNYCRSFIPTRWNESIACLRAFDRGAESGKSRFHDLRWAALRRPMCRSAARTTRRTAAPVRSSYPFAHELSAVPRAPRRTTAPGRGRRATAAAGGAQLRCLWRWTIPFQHRGEAERDLLGDILRDARQTTTWQLQVPLWAGTLALNALVSFGFRAVLSWKKIRVALFYL